MNNLMQKILIDSAIEYSKNLLFMNENPDICIDDIHTQISNMFREFKKEDIANAIKEKCKKEISVEIINSINNIDDCRCNSILMMLIILFTEDTRINNVFNYTDRETILMFHQVLKQFRNLQQFIIYFDSSYIYLCKKDLEKQKIRLGCK